MIIKIVLIENGEIINASLQNPELPYPLGNWMPLEQALEQSCTYRNTVPSVPEEIPLWAFRAIIDLKGMTEQIVAIINELPGPDKIIAKFISASTLT